MATLVLSTVGSLVGGPIGGSVGALIGGQIDGRLLAPKGRQGPRLGQLAVQTSIYGSAIPKLFGTLRVAGTVIWATDLREAQHRSGGGKGQPKSTSYSYSASFAVLLSGRAIGRVGRIWAEGKLLRGNAGDWKSQIGAFRLHAGGEAQAVDPLIASAEGIALTPAYRDMAYAVFEDLQLADFGNRIPSLTFEVVADELPPSVGGIAAALSDGAVADAGTALLGGFAAGGDSVRGCLEALGEAMPLTLVDDGRRLAIGQVPNETINLPEEGAGEGRVSIERRAAGTVADEVALSYHEPARDWQAGLQRARRAGPGRRVAAVELPAALEADAAKALAEARLARDWTERARATVTLPWRWLGLEPGDCVTLPGQPGRWRVSSTLLEGMAVKLELVATAGAVAAVMPAASGGRFNGGPDRLHGPTQLMLLDLPAADLASGPRLWLAAAGPSPGWRRAELTVRVGGGDEVAVGPSAVPATMGTAATVLAAGSTALMDLVASVEVELLHDGMELGGSDAVGASAEANLALLGDELLQFGEARRVAPRRWRLSRLLRGRRGTEWAMSGHAAGERFLLIEPSALVPFDPPASAIGGTVTAFARGIGDVSPVEASTLLVGRAVQPPSPVRLRIVRAVNGDVAIGWTRRSRLGWSWLDGVDAPIGEAAERYRLTLTAGGLTRTEEVVTPAFLFTAADRLTAGIDAGASIEVTVWQIGDGAASEPVRTTFTS